MLKLKKAIKFLVIFLPAFLLAHILLGELKISPFTLNDPELKELIATLLAWFFAWSVSAILYVTLRDAFKAPLNQ